MNKRGRKIAKTNGIFSSFFIVIKMFKYTKIIKKYKKNLSFVFIVQNILWKEEK